MNELTQPLQATLTEERGMDRWIATITWRPEWFTNFNGAHKFLLWDDPEDPPFILRNGEVHPVIRRLPSDGQEILMRPVPSRRRRLNLGQFWVDMEHQSIKDEIEEQVFSAEVAGHRVTWMPIVIDGHPMFNDPGKIPVAINPDTLEEDLVPGHDKSDRDRFLAQVDNLEDLEPGTFHVELIA